jgi:peptide-methionine (S)-S-oxide reductase
MKTLLVIFVCFAALISCAQPQNSTVKIPVASTQKAAKNEAVATFGQGCFWHSEIVFQSLAGVRDAVSGYAGGTNKNPDYESVCSGITGHAETVQVYYDPSVVSYETLVRAFFASQDPTQLNRQGNDEGTQYRSIAFYRTEKEKQVLEAEIKRLTDEKKYTRKIVTEVVPFTKFYKGEDYHQEYINRHPENPYVRNVSIPDYIKFRSEFKAVYKDKS